MTGRGHRNDTGYATCPPPCGKVRYLSRKEAKKAGRAKHSSGERQAVRFRVYQHDGYWHVASWQHQARVAFYREAGSP